MQSPLHATAQNLHQNRIVMPTWLRAKSQPLIKSLRIDAGVMRQQFDQLASLCARFRDRPLHHLLADAAAAAMSGDADILDQAARGALRTQPRQDAELQAADHRALAVLGDHELDIRIAVDASRTP